MVMMATLAQRFFTVEQQRQILHAVQQAEQGTSGEIVPMVVSASHAYPEARLAAAMTLSLACSLVTTLAVAPLLWWRGELLWLFLFFLPLYLLLFRFVVPQAPWLVRLFVHRRTAEAEVERAAFTAFYTEGLHRTRDATGVLIFISVLERRVWILGDRGINARIQPRSWQEFVDRLIQGIRVGEACEALCGVIEEMGEVLRKRFPVRSDDRNELADLVIVDEPAVDRPSRLLIR
jgi:putative membrane protein